jgi:hypothetical protein
MDYERSLTRLVAAIAVAMPCFNGCGLSGGAAHADIILDLSNASPTTIVVHWTGSQNGYASIHRCDETRQGLDAGDYTIVVGDPPSTTFPPPCGQRPTLPTSARSSSAQMERS